MRKTSFYEIISGIFAERENKVQNREYIPLYFFCLRNSEEIQMRERICLYKLFLKY